ncbi:hypothetical protein JCM10213_008274 [Rhodosporidiobolus nylandii]
MTSLVTQPLLHRLPLPPRPIPLPLDIYAEVLDHLAEDLPSPTARDALAACCLASKDFHRLAYPLLHQRIVLYVELKEGGDNLVHTFTKSSMQLALRLAGLPRLAARVRHLALQTAPRKDFPSLRIQRLDYTAMMAWEELAEQLPPGLSLKLPNLPSYRRRELSSRRSRRWYMPAALMHNVRQLEVEWLVDINALQTVPSLRILRILSLDLESHGSSPTIALPPVTHLALKRSPGFSDIGVLFRNLGSTLTHITLSILMDPSEPPPSLSLIPSLTTLTFLLPVRGWFMNERINSAERVAVLGVVQELLATRGMGSPFSLELRTVDEADAVGKKTWARQLRWMAWIGRVKSEARFSRVGSVNASALGLQEGEAVEETGWLEGLLL